MLCGDSHPGNDRLGRERHPARTSPVNPSVPSLHLPVIECPQTQPQPQLNPDATTNSFSHTGQESLSLTAQMEKDRGWHPAPSTDKPQRRQCPQPAALETVRHGLDQRLVLVSRERMNQVFPGHICSSVLAAHKDHGFSNWQQLSGLETSLFRFKFDSCSSLPLP